MTQVGCLSACWRENAQTLRRWGARDQAEVLEACAEALEALQGTEANRALTLSEAAEESGYSADHLGRLVRQGKIPNAGRRGAPRIRRADLHGRPGLARQHEGPQVDRTQIVRPAINEGAG